MTVLMKESLHSAYEKACRMSDELLEQMAIETHMSFQERIHYLGMYANYDHPDHTFCVLFPDFAPLSFGFVMYVKAKAGHGIKPKEWIALEHPELVGYTAWFNGGLIFHGSHDGFGSGAAPTFSVTLTKTSGWSVHT
jgi:hypothetical protein